MAALVKVLKNLKTPLNHWKRVHIDRHLVLTFSIDDETKTLILEDYDRLKGQQQFDVL